MAKSKCFAASAFRLQFYFHLSQSGISSLQFFLPPGMKYCGTIKGLNSSLFGTAQPKKLESSASVFPGITNGWRWKTWNNCVNYTAIEEELSWGGKEVKDRVMETLFKQMVQEFFNQRAKYFSDAAAHLLNRWVNRQFHAHHSLELHQLLITDRKLMVFSHFQTRSQRTTHTGIEKQRWSK